MIPLRLYLPYASYPLVVHVLDPELLGRMRSQIPHILWTLVGTQGKATGLHEWSGHPVLEMWRGYESSLLRLLHCCLREMELRGWPRLQEPILTAEDADHWNLPHDVVLGEVRHPEWLGSAMMHASHRACLKKRDEEWYQQFDWDEPAVFSYWTPQRPAKPGDYLIRDQDMLVVTRSLENGDNLCVDAITGDEVVITNREVVRHEWTIGQTMPLHEYKGVAGEGQ